MQLIDEEEEEEEEGRHWMEKLFQEDKLQLLNFMQLSLALSHIFSFLSPTHPFFFFYDFFCVSFNHWVELSWGKKMTTMVTTTIPRENFTMRKKVIFTDHWLSGKTAAMRRLIDSIFHKRLKTMTTTTREREREMINLYDCLRLARWCD